MGFRVGVCRGGVNVLGDWAAGGYRESGGDEDWCEVGFMQLGPFCIKAGSGAEVGFMQRAGRCAPRPARLGRPA